MVTFQISTVSTRTHIVAIHPRVGHQFDEVLVAFVVLGQYDEVVAAHVLLALMYLLGTMTSHIHLTAEDGLEGFQSLFLPFFVHTNAVVVELFDAKHVTMIGHRHASHAVTDSLIHKL